MITLDRFHHQQFCLEAVQEVRIALRREEMTRIANERDEHRLMLKAFADKGEPLKDKDGSPIRIGRRPEKSNLIDRNTIRSCWTRTITNSFIIDSFNIKFHVSHKLLDNIDFDSRSILFIIEKKENNLTIFDIGKNIEGNYPCTTRFTFAFCFDSHTDSAYVFCNLIALQRIVFNAFKKLIVVLFKTWIFLSETFCFFAKFRYFV